MNITELSIKKPTIVVLGIILVVILGIMGYIGLGASLFPAVEFPIISITTNYYGAGAEEIENDIAKTIEDAVSEINGIDTIYSTSGEGYGNTTLQFNMDVNIDTAILDVQNEVDRITGDLPEDAEKPVISRFSPISEPILLLSISGENSYDEIYNETERMKKQIEKMKGVSSVKIEGGLEKQLTVEIDKTLLESYGLSVNTILGRIRAENLNMPAGQIKQQKGKEAVRLFGEFKNIEEIKNLPIPVGNKSILLGDIANIMHTYPDSEKIVRLTGKSAIGLYIYKQNEANIVQVTNRVKKEIENIKSTLPQGMSVAIADDNTAFINSSLNETNRNLLEGILTTALILFLFLRNWRSSIIVLIAIPTSLLATFFMMKMLGFTLNLLSLMALSVCIGILVDDSIVVLENIQRHFNMGKDPKVASLEGRKEIATAAISITLCDVVVFAPIAFLSGIVGNFFREFGLTVVCSTVFSLIVSFTVTPMLASWTLKSKKNKEKSIKIEGNKTKKTKWSFEFFIRTYESLLLWALRNRIKVIAIVILGIATSAMLIPLGYISSEFLPMGDRSKLVIDVNLIPGSKLSQTDEKVKTIEEYLSSLDEVKDYFSIVGKEKKESSASIIVRLKEKNERNKSQSELAVQIRKWVKDLTGVQAFVSEPSVIGQTSAEGSKPLIVNVMGPNRDQLKELAKSVEDIMASVSGTTDIDDSTRSTQKEISIKPDRLACVQAGIVTSDMSSVLRTAIEGTNAGIYRKNGNEYDIVVRYMEEQVNTIDKISSIKVINQFGQQYNLSQLADIAENDSPKELSKKNRENVVAVSANIEGRPLGDISKEVSDKINQMVIPYGYSIGFSGEEASMRESFTSLTQVLLISILLVYMILVFLYESYVTPIIRLLALPCGIIGALFALAITKNTLNINSIIGIIMLDALVAKNGTLLIDYTNTLMKNGIPLREALITAGKTRLSPIIMTTVTMIVGMLPAALALGDGAEIKSSMPIALIGGLITSTVLSPILIPVVYTLIDDIKTKYFKHNKAIEFKRGANV